MNTLTAIPDFAAGETVVYRRTYADYPASTHNLVLYLNGPATNGAVGTVTKDGDTFIITLSSTITGALTAGHFDWEERATVIAGGAVYRADFGAINVWPNMATLAAGGKATAEERMLAVVEAKLFTHLAAGYEKYIVLGRELDTIPTKDLWSVYAQLRAIVARQRGGRPKPIHVIFPGVGAE